MQNLNGQLKNPYPAIDLRRAYSYLLKIAEASSPSKNTFERKELLASMGFEEKNGTGHNAVGALSHFGLLHRETRNNKSIYNITPLATNLLTSENDRETWSKLAHQAATHPVLFTFLAAEFPDNKLPVGLETRLIRKYKEVTAKNVGAVIYRYKESLKFVSAGLQVEPMQITFDETSIETQPQTRPPQPINASERMDFPFPLSDGTSITFSLPTVLSKKDSNRIVRYITALTETLVEN